jgi:hypothetical protein
MSIRSGNCTLAGNDLAISGATAAQADARTGNDQCTGWPDSESVQQDELPAAQISSRPAELVTIQAGADDIDFSQCMAWELTKFAAFHAQGTRCVKNGSVIPAVTAELAHVRSALTSEIEQTAPYAKHIVVLNYYQVIPEPTEFQKSSISSGGKVDPVCWGLSHNLQGAYNDAVTLQSALNVSIDQAVSNAHSAGINNVQLVDLTDLEAGHEMCTGNPALFSGEPMPKSQFDTDLQVIIACHAYFSQSCQTTEPYAETDLANHSWRAAHPNTFGQQDIASAVEAQLGNV